MHESSLEAMALFARDHLGERRGAPLQVLDLGAMDVNGSYRQFFDDPSWSYVGLDAAPGKGVDVVLDSPYSYRGLASRSFDVVVSGQAFEHIRFPWVTVLEVARLLRPGGLTCLIAPASGPEHRYPVDCWRYYPDGWAALAAWGDLQVLDARTAWTPARDYRDDSAVWQDSVLVAQKPLLQGRHAVANRVKQRVLRSALRLHAERQDDRVAQLGPSEMPS